MHFEIDVLNAYTIVYVHYVMMHLLLLPLFTCDVLCINVYENCCQVGECKLPQNGHNDTSNKE